MSIRFILLLTLFNSVSIRAGRVLLALFALELGAEPITIGVLAATFSLFPTFFSWHAGKLADRFGSRWLLTGGALGVGVGMLVPYFFPGMPAIFIAGAATGISFSIYAVSLQNLVGLMSTEDTRARNFSNHSLMMSISNFLGPLIAGFSIDHFGHAPTFLFLAILCVIPVPMLALRGRMLPKGVRHKSRSAGGLGKMLKDAAVRRMLATSSLLHAGSDMFQFYLPVYGYGIGLSASTIGIVLSMNAAAAFVVRLVLPYTLRTYSEEKVLMFAFCLGAASFVMIPFFENWIVLAIAAFIFGLGMGGGQPVVTMRMFSYSAKGRSGETLGLRMTVNRLTRLVGPMVFGVIASAIGLPALFWINAALLGSGAVLSRPREPE
jgi:MFS family permease